MTLSTQDRWGDTRRAKFEGAMPEHADVAVELGENDGDSTRTAIVFTFEAGAPPTLVTTAADGTARRTAVEFRELRIELVGEWEREGMARAMVSAAMELLKG
jgi:hypothetical protein